MCCVVNKRITTANGNIMETDYSSLPVDPNAYKTFLSSTGFGDSLGRNVMASDEVRVTEGKGREFIDHYMASSRPNKAEHRPDSAPAYPYRDRKGLLGKMGGGLIAGHSVDEMQPKDYKTPFAHVNIGKNTITTTADDRQTEWRAVDIGTGMSGPLRENVSGFVTGLDSLKLMMGFFFFMTLSFVFGALQIKKKSTANGYWMAAVFSLMAFILASYYHARQRTIGASTAGAGEHLAEIGGYPVKKATDETTYHHYEVPELPPQHDTQADRYRMQGTDPNEVEGPRPGFGYYRPQEARPQITRDQLMNDAGLMNFKSDEQFQDYMAKLRGEAVSQFHQVKPYYTSAANWDHRHTSVDWETVHGIPNEPRALHFKTMMRDPKSELGGAKTNHMRDPPYGYVQPVEHEHPWVVDAIDSREQAVTMRSEGERMSMGPPRQQMRQAEAQPSLFEQYGGIKPSPADKMLNEGWSPTDHTSERPAMLAIERKREDERFQAHLGPPKQNGKAEDELPDWIKPMETSKPQQQAPSASYDPDAGWVQQAQPQNPQQPRVPMYPQNAAPNSNTEPQLPPELMPIETSVKKGLKSAPGASEAAHQYMKMRDEGMPAISQPPAQTNTAGVGGIADGSTTIGDEDIFAAFNKGNDILGKNQTANKGPENVEALFAAAFAEKGRATDKQIEQYRLDNKR